MQGSDRQDRHERFKELCALAHANALSIGERFELEEHLRICKPCREVYEAYALVSEAGMAFLAAPGELPPGINKGKNELSSTGGPVRRAGHGADQEGQGDARPR